MTWKSRVRLLRFFPSLPEYVRPSVEQKKEKHHTGINIDYLVKHWRLIVYSAQDILLYFAKIPFVFQWWDVLLNSFLCDALCFHRLGRRGKTVIMSIHQPRYSIFKTFDTLSLLSNGEFVYQGPANQAMKYFEEIGKLDRWWSVSIEIHKSFRDCFGFAQMHFVIGWKISRHILSLDNTEHWDGAARPIPPWVRLPTFAPLPCVSSALTLRLDHVYFLNCFSIFPQVLYVNHTTIPRIFSWMLSLNVKLVSGMNWLSAQVFFIIILFNYFIIK